MELRVLHAATHKMTWYGQWGYQYGRGAFNITHNKYALLQFHYEGDLSKSLRQYWSHALPETSAADDLSCIDCMDVMVYCPRNNILGYMLYDSKKQWSLSRTSYS